MGTFNAFMYVSLVIFGTVGWLVSINTEEKTDKSDVENAEVIEFLDGCFLVWKVTYALTFTFLVYPYVAISAIMHDAGIKELAYFQFAYSLFLIGNVLLTLSMARQLKAKPAPRQVITEQGTVVTGVPVDVKAKAKAERNKLLNKLLYLPPLLYMWYLLVVSLTA